MRIWRGDLRSGRKAAVSDAGVQTTPLYPRPLRLLYIQRGTFPVPEWRELIAFYAPMYVWGFPGVFRRPNAISPARNPAFGGGPGDGRYFFFFGGWGRLRCRNLDMQVTRRRNIRYFWLFVVTGYRNFPRPHLLFFKYAILKPP